MSRRYSVLATFPLVFAANCAPQLAATPASASAATPSSTSTTPPTRKDAESDIEVASSETPTFAHPAHWEYEGDEGPTTWASLSPAYESCGAGVMQSPVDIPANGDQKAASFSMSFGKSLVTVHHQEHADDIVDNGHTIQVDIADGEDLKTAKDSYLLKQFHFHTPSENRVAGKQYPMEAHFVHQSESGNYAVIAVFFEAGKASPFLDKVIENFPKNRGEMVHPKEVMDTSLHLPASLDSFHFFGSFTTPPCTENVEWIVLKAPTTASVDQIATFASKLGHNNRPVQAWRGRPISSNEVQTTED